MSKMIYCISAGHNPDGKIACGAVGFLKESTEARKITKEVVRLLKLNSCTAYNCTCDNGNSPKDVLKKIVNAHNKYNSTLNISIHLNSGRDDSKGDNKNGGTEALVCTNVGIKKEVSERYLNEMEKLGFANRGVKTRTNLYFLNKTVKPSILFEICFVDDKDDYLLYAKVGHKKIAQAIVKAILDKKTIKTEDEKATATYTTSVVNTVKYYKSFKNKSIIDGLNSIKVNSSFTNRKKIAVANGIKNYKGTEEQNEKLCALAAKGKLIRP